MILLDTGYFVALFSPADELHERAVAWSLPVSEPTLITEYVLWECVNTFSQPKHRDLNHALIEHVHSDPACEVVPATTDLFASGLGLHRDRPDKAWSLTDLAYDLHFQPAGFTALLRSVPSA